MSISSGDLPPPLYVLLPALYRAPAIFILFLFFLGLNVFTFNYYKVDFPLILRMGSDEILQEKEIFQSVMVLSSLLGSSVYLSMTYVGNHYVQIAAPCMFYTLSLYMLLTRRQAFYHRKRQFLLSVLKRIVTPIITPGERVLFSENLVADALTSLSKIFGDFQVMGCILATLAIHKGKEEGQTATCSNSIILPMIVSLPFLFRCKQCFIEYRATSLPKDLANFIKYSTAFPAIWSSHLLRTTENERMLGICIISCFINTTYSYIWDIFMDWGLGNPCSVHFPLREILAYPKWWYHVAMCFDFILRYVWIVPLTRQLNLSSEYQIALFQALEVARRSMWNIFRVEYEYSKTRSFTTHLKTPNHFDLPKKQAVGSHLAELLIADTKHES